MSLFQSSILTLVLAGASTLSVAAVYGFQAQPSRAEAPPTKPTEPPEQTTPAPPPTRPTPPTTPPTAVAAPTTPTPAPTRLDRQTDWKTGDLLVLAIAYDPSLDVDDRMAGGLDAFNRGEWKGRLVGGSIHSVGKTKCGGWPRPRDGSEYFTNRDFAEAIQLVRDDAEAIRRARGGIACHCLVVYFSSTAPDADVALKDFPDATLQWYGPDVQKQRDCKVLNRLFPGSRLVACGSLDQADPKRAFRYWLAALDGK